MPRPSHQDLNIESNFNIGNGLETGRSPVYGRILNILPCMTDGAKANAIMHRKYFKNNIGIHSSNNIHPHQRWKVLEPARTQVV